MEKGLLAMCFSLFWLTFRDAIKMSNRIISKNLHNLKWKIIQYYE